MLTKKREVLLSSDESFAEINGERFRVKNLNEHDHEGHCWLWLELETGEEFISYDDGQTWQDPDFNGYW